MPGMNGLECLQELKKAQKFNGIPVIIYTTYLSSEQESNCLDLGASVIVKPNTYSELLEVIESKIFEFSGPLI
jgi:DNA-binding response OmpR family regulator